MLKSANIAILQFLFAGIAFAADVPPIVTGCTGAPSPTLVESLINVSTNYLVIKAPNNSTYILNGKCFIIDRSQFGTDLQFYIMNRFPKTTSATVGYVFVKSTKRFSILQTKKIKVSRGNGWSYPGKSGMSVLGAFDAKPVKISPKKWDELYSEPTTTTSTPEQMAKALGIVWHAYGQPDGSDASTDEAEFWKLDTGFNPKFDAVTNYLIRFDVNTGTQPSLVPFSVTAQSELQFFQLTIDSNIDVLSSGYWFQLR